MDTEMFRAICAKVAEEKDPQKVELLKQRLRLLLMEESTPAPAESKVN
jgi:hypothetical protein